MVGWNRYISFIGGRRVISVLGGLYVAFGLGWTFTETVGEPGASTAELIVFTLIAGPGAVILFIGYRLPRFDIRAEFYPTVAGWCLGGLGVMLAILGFYSLQPGERVDDISVILILTGLASVAGLAAGVHNAQAKTRTRELEETIERLEKSNERLEQFAYAASHDLQEPLRMVSSYLQLIEQRYGDELDEDGKEFLEFAVNGADRMRNMITGLLQYSRIDSQSDPLQPVELDDVLAEVKDDLQVRIEESDAEIMAESLPRVEGDREQLRQVFQNLLDNAIEYSDGESPRVYVSAERDGSKWAISVRDEGIGIDPEDADRIFEVFQSLHSQDEHSGTGIGLALCERIVERHGGDIWVQSEPGEGATFTFTLPAAGN